MMTPPHHDSSWQLLPALPRKVFKLYKVELLLLFTTNKYTSCVSYIEWYDNILKITQYCIKASLYK